MSITYIKDKINNLLTNASPKSKFQKITDFLTSREIWTVLIIILVGLSCFGLGRLSIIFESKTPISIKYDDPSSMVGDSTSNISNTKSSSNTCDGCVIASKTGKKYHYPWCSSAGTISEQN